jgi:V/A-type H+-transporting ATPase subunit C
MAGPVRTYGFINAKLRAKISKLLSWEFFQSMIRSHSLIEAIGMLRTTEYGAVDAVYSRTGDLKLGELELYRAELKTLTAVERYVEDEVSDFVRALTTRYEIEEVKNCIRLWFERVTRGRNVDTKVPYLLREPVHYDIPWDALVNAATIEDLATALAGTPYAEIVEKTAGEVEARSSLFPLESALDRYFYTHLFRVVERLDDRDRRIAERLIGMEVDLANVEWILRYKTYYEMSTQEAVDGTIPFGAGIDRETIRSSYQSNDTVQTLTDMLRHRYPPLATLYTERNAHGESRLSLLEALLNELLLLEVHRVLGGYPFTIGVILAYFVLKQAEIRRIMTVLNAKSYDIEPERIRRLL